MSTLGQAGYYNVMSGSRYGTIRLKPLVMISTDDAETLKQYGLDPDPNVYGNSVTFGELEDHYTDYNISDDIPIYFIYKENVFTQPADISEFDQYSAGDPDGGVMRVYFDDNNEIVMMCDPDLF